MLYVQTDNGVVEAMLFYLPSNSWPRPCVYPVAKCGENSICAYFEYDFSWIKVIKNLCLHGRFLIRVLS